MRTYKVIFHPLARVDLFALYRYVAEQAGRHVASAYIDRIEAVCMTLGTFPERGTRRDDLRRGVRTLGFERRATIAFEVQDSEIVIIRIFYGGQDMEQALGGAAND